MRPDQVQERMDRVHRDFVLAWDERAGMWWSVLSSLGQQRFCRSIFVYVTLTRTRQRR